MAGNERRSCNKKVSCNSKNNTFKELKLVSFNKFYHLEMFLKLHLKMSEFKLENLRSPKAFKELICNFTL